MSTPTLPRLLLFTAAALASAVAMLTDYSIVGILLFGFSWIILMNRHEQKQHWTKPLTKWQIARGFIPITLIIALIAYLVVTDYRSSDASKETAESISSVSKKMFIIAVVFMIGLPWFRWFRTRQSGDFEDPTV